MYTVNNLNLNQLTSAWQSEDKQQRHAEGLRSIRGLLDRCYAEAQG